MSKPSRRGRGGVTIEDVARLAGVSPMTVSRAVNGETNVRESTRKAVLEAVRTLRYSPNPAARSLAGAGATHIGLLYSNPSAAYLSQFLVGALDGCRRVGCQLVVDSCPENKAEERAAARRLVDDMVEGVIMPAPLSEFLHVTREFEAAGIPIVGVAIGRMRAPGLNVRIDDRRASYEMAQHLLGLGHREIGFIRGHPNQSASEERWLGFADALTQAGLDPASVPVAQGYFSYRSGFEAAEKLLSGHPSLTAVFASNDDMAAATLNVAHLRGMQAPADLSVVGFDDTAIATTVWPELTTVRQPIEAMAGHALELLLGELRARRAGGAGAPAEEILGHTLVVRDSTAPPRGRTPPDA
jgi:LacI family transcriptional regulator, galactose operon repressor